MDWKYIGALTSAKINSVKMIVSILVKNLIKMC